MEWQCQPFTVNEAKYTPDLPYLGSKVHVVVREPTLVYKLASELISGIRGIGSSWVLREAIGDEASKGLTDRLALELCQATFERRPLLVRNRRSRPEQRQTILYKGIDSRSERLLYDQWFQRRDRRQKNRSVACLKGRRCKDLHGEKGLRIRNRSSETGSKLLEDQLWIPANRAKSLHRESGGPKSFENRCRLVRSVMQTKAVVQAYRCPENSLCQLSALSLGSGCGRKALKLELKPAAALPGGLRERSKRRDGAGIEERRDLFHVAEHAGMRNAEHDPRAIGPLLRPSEDSGSLVK